MESVVRAAVVYLFLMLIFRIAGRRTLAELSSFDFVLLLMVGEATQQALLGEDFSITNACLVITTLMGMDIVLACVKRYSGRADRWLEGVPMVILADGQILKDRLKRARVDEADILHAARERCGIGELSKLRYAVLERNGGITVIPAE